MQGRLIRILALIKKEFLIIFKDPKNRALIIVPPIMQLLIFANAITLEVRNIDISVLDFSNTSYSRELISRFNNSKWFRKIYYQKTLKELKNDIDMKKSQCGIIIQNNFGKNIINKKGSEILVIIDGRQTNSASLVTSYANKIISDYSDELEKKFSIEKNAINVQIRNWFNTNIEYKWFLVVSLIVMLALVLSLLLSSLTIAQERELGTFNQILVSPLSNDEILFSKIVTPLFTAFISSIVITLIAIFCFKIPFSGSVVLYLFSTLISLFSIVGIGLFISSFAYTQQQAVLGVFAFQTPAVLLSGFVSPIEDMPDFFRFISLFNPLRYYMFIIKGIYFKNMDCLTVFKNIIPLIMIAFLTLALARLSFHFKKDN